MSEEKKYPYIGENLAGDAVLFTETNVGYRLLPKGYNGMPLNEDQRTWKETRFKDITREYLMDTYGRVENEEHADFIIKLAATKDCTDFKLLKVEE